jgi:hypothetical protein
MTPGAITPSQTERDKTFSERIIFHARSLGLTQLGAVGNWLCGQGIRRARQNDYFWDLTLNNYSPLGIHHPTTLAPIEISSWGVYSFSNDMHNLYPALETWQWTVISVKHSWLQDKTWDRVSAWELNRKTDHLWETDPTLKTDKGWLGFSHLDRLTSWCVQIDSEAVWCASKISLPISDLTMQEKYQWLRPFLSADALANDGRLSELITLLSDVLKPDERNGLNFKFYNKSAEKLAEQGLSCDGSKNNISCYFPLSILHEDIQGLRSLLKD